MSSSPPETELFLRFTRRLDQAGIEYMVTGSVAAIAYGRPRMTNDVDLIASMDLAGALRLSKLFPSEEFYFPPMEIVASELARARRGHFNILHIDSGFKADIYLLGEDAFRAWALARVRRVAIGPATVPMAPPEYVIIRKLEFFKEGESEKHLRDIALMLRNSIKQIDIPALEQLIEERGLAFEWARAKTVAI